MLAVGATNVSLAGLILAGIAFCVVSTAGCMNGCGCVCSVLVSITGVCIGELRVARAF